MELSIIIPTYNYGRYLRRAIDSALSQADDRCEIIVVDDGSTDDTSAILTSYARTVRAIRQEHVGPYVACRRGFDAGTRSWVMFLDADDRLRDGFIAAVRRAMSTAAQASVLFPSIVNVRADGSERPTPPPTIHQEPIENLRGYFRKQLRVSTGGTLFRHEVVARLRAIPARQFRDHGFDQVLMAYALSTHHAAVAPDAVMEVHDHPGRLRDDAAAFCGSAEGTIATLFDTDLLPTQARALRGMYEAGLLLEKGRLLYRSRRYPDAARTYARAFIAAPGEAARHPKHCWRGVRAALMATLPRPPAVARPDARRADLDAFKQEPMSFLLRCAVERGDVARIRLGREALLLNDPTDIRHVLAINDLNYTRNSFDATFAPVFEGSLFTAAGASHRRDRKQLTPPFQTRSLAGLVPIVSNQVRAMMEAWRDDFQGNIVAELMKMYVQTSGRIMLGLDDDQAIIRLFTAIKRAHPHASANWHRGRQARLALRWFAPREHLRYRRRGREVDQFLKEIIDAKRTALSSGDFNREDAGWTDLLTVFLRCQRDAPQGRSHRWVREQAASMFLAGYDGIANATAWTLYHLARNPRYERDIVHECRTLLGDRPPSFADVPRLVRTRAAFEEGMRLNPSPWLLWRRAIHEDRLPSGAAVPAGAQVFISPYVLHRRANLFPDPDRFDPSRFDDAPRRERSPYSYIPFGGGPRICLGEPMARLMGVPVLAQLVPRFQFELTTDVPIVPVTLNGFSAQPPDGLIPMRIRRRQASDDAPRTAEVTVLPIRTSAFGGIHAP